MTKKSWIKIEHKKGNAKIDKNPHSCIYIYYLLKNSLIISYRPYNMYPTYNIHI